MEVKVELGANWFTVNQFQLVSDLNDDLSLQKSVVVLNMSRVLRTERETENKHQTTVNNE